ncbi:MAG: peptidase M61 [Rhodothermaceae bacterium]|nr:MAG: peptidase M61 [Rhodothermaceae bacterium]
MKALLLLLLIPLLPMTASARQPALTYHVGWGAPNAHYFHIRLEVTGHDAPHVDFRIPEWRPGRYILQNYAKDVVGFAAEDGEGRPLPFEKIDKNTWRVERGDAAKVVATYRSYARQLDAGASYLDAREAYLNPITALMNVRGRMTEPVAVVLHHPEDWRVATALDYDAALGAYVAADYHELVDSPILMSPDFKRLTFEEGGATFEIAIQGTLPVDDAALIEDHRRIVAAQMAMMRDVPFRRYLFMYHLLPYRFGHGVEHKNSTSIVLGPSEAFTRPDDPAATPGRYNALLGVASHEFFHAWHVERIRPAALLPTDYAQPQYTTQMWIFEGITDYYADVFLLRAGLMSEEGFLDEMAATIRRFDLEPGRKVTSIAMTSFDSWAKQGQAPPHTFYSFYTAGKVMGMLLDLEVRARTGGTRSLDDVIRYLNETYARQGRGVPEDGFRQALEHVTGTSFQAFFDAHIYGTEDVDYDRYLAHAGLRLERRTDPARPAAWLGVRTDADGRITDVWPGSGAFEAGLDLDDVLLAVEGNDVSAGSLDDLLHPFQPGDEVTVTVRRWGEEQTFRVRLDARLPDAYAIVPVAAPAPGQAALRAAWLGR